LSTTHASTRRRAAPRGVGRRRSRATGRRRLALLLLTLTAAAAAAAAIAGLGPLGEAVRELTLPLRHEDIIRQQAADKDLDAALIAAVIYEESKFRDQTSAAGAKGLMQILPSTAQFIARKSGGTQFELRDLATPQVNISYGAWYLRYLKGHYDGNTSLAVAAYNAGEGKVDEWVGSAGGVDRFDSKRDIPFPETREYVAGVQKHRDEYREHYADELGY
jgi:soluble lytic murein transglycosylase